MFNKMFGGFAQSLTQMVAAAMPDATDFKPKGWQGLRGKKFRISGPPAQYQNGPNGDIHRARAIRRADRWLKGHPGQDAKTMPRHIWNNYADATNYTATA